MTTSDRQMEVARGIISDIVDEIKEASPEDVEHKVDILMASVQGDPILKTALIYHFTPFGVSFVFLEYEYRYYLGRKLYEMFPEY